jgi:hypothetical protein
MKTTNEMQDAIIRGLERWRISLSDAYNGVEDAIREERWDDVATMMAQISQKTAQTGINMRAALAKNGMLSNEE